MCLFFNSILIMQLMSVINIILFLGMYITLLMLNTFQHALVRTKRRTVNNTERLTYSRRGIVVYIMFYFLSNKTIQCPLYVNSTLQRHCRYCFLISVIQFKYHISTINNYKNTVTSVVSASNISIGVYLIRLTCKFNILKL